MKNLKQVKRTVIFLFILLLTFSCSDNEEVIKSNNLPINENFIDISTAKLVATKLRFSVPSKTNTSNKNTPNNLLLKTIKDISEVINENKKTSFYVINYVEGGYIILSSDKRTQPILGYSEKGKFVIDEKFYPLGLKFWIADTKKQIQEIQNSNIMQSKINKEAWDDVQNTFITSNQSLFSKEPPIECYEHTETVIVGPLLNSTWDQLGGFNDALPYINCNGYPFQVYAGCVPIAMGQVMKYHEYPTNYNWSSIPLNYATTTSANFIKDIHNAIGSMNSGNPIYNCDGTGVSASANMGNVLITKFSYSSASWANYNYNTVRDNINYYRPVILSGDNGITGHMWVCDGYMQMS